MKLKRLKLFAGVERKTKYWLLLDDVSGYHNGNIPSPRFSFSHLVLFSMNFERKNLSGTIQFTFMFVF